jgi:biopolymer transport protein ExbB
MKKYIIILLIIAVSMIASVMAQNSSSVSGTQAADSLKTEQKAEITPAQGTSHNAAPLPPAEEKRSFHQVLREKFIEGGAGWMAPILLCLIIGLGLAIERIIYLNMSTTNTRKLLAKIEDKMQNEGIERAKEVCRNSRGPVSGIFYQGLDRMDQGMDIVEKSILSYGSVLSGRLENNLTWIALFIALSPMLGFLGTVVGMVEAFESIEVAGDISPNIVAGGIKVALLTTVFGLIVAMILQILYNYIVAKIDQIINTMEDATISFVDILLKYNKAKK